MSAATSRSQLKTSTYVLHDIQDKKTVHALKIYISCLIIKECIIINWDKSMYISTKLLAQVTSKFILCSYQKTVE